MTIGPSRHTLVLRQDYFDDAHGWTEITGLIQDVFEVDISPLNALGGHDRSSFPSAYFDTHNRCIANLSAFSMPLVINGRHVKAAAWQSGAVRPQWRGLGLFRDLIRLTLERCDAGGFEAIVLYTDKPALYEPYAFKVVPQFRFVGVPPATSGPAPQGARALDITNPVDLGLARHTLENRVPVSSRFAVSDQAKMFLLNAYLVDGVRLHLFPDTGAIVAWRPADAGGFELLDIAGPEIPSLAAILGALDVVPRRIEVFFPPDRLRWQGEPVVETGAQVFMMRAPDALIPTEPFCLSPMAEF